MEIQKKIAEALMTAYGYNKDDPSHSKEWSEERPDSTFNTMLHNANIAVETILNESEEEEEEFEQEPLLGVVTPPEQRTTLSKNAALFIFMDAPEGIPTYVKDVREWLQAIEDAGIPDNTEVEGYLHITYDYTYQDIEKKPSTLTLYNHRPR